MFGIASRYVKARTCPSTDGRKAPAFHIQFFICKARALLLARRSLETSPNLIPPTYAQLGHVMPSFIFFRQSLNCFCIKFTYAVRLFLKNTASAMSFVTTQSKKYSESIKDLIFRENIS